AKLSVVPRVLPKDTAMRVARNLWINPCGVFAWGNYTLGRLHSGSSCPAKSIQAPPPQSAEKEDVQTPQPQSVQEWRPQNT
ncbi:hypothetical protein HDU82_004439, partial [Entophlyctis luteolus]